MRTVEDYARVLMPGGSRPKQITRFSEKRPRLDKIPYCPADCFGLAMALLEKSGAYHYTRAITPKTDDHEDLWNENSWALRHRGAQSFPDEALFWRLKPSELFTDRSDVKRFSKLAARPNAQKKRQRFYKSAKQNAESPSEEKHKKARYNTQNTLERLCALEDVRIGRAWSLLLPFLSNTDKKRTLQAARLWLAETAAGGHNPFWFDGYHLKHKNNRRAEELYDYVEFFRSTYCSPGSALSESDRKHVLKLLFTAILTQCDADEKIEQINRCLVEYRQKLGPIGAKLICWANKRIRKENKKLCKIDETVIQNLWEQMLCLREETPVKSSFINIKHHNINLKSRLMASSNKTAKTIHNKDVVNGFEKNHPQWWLPAFRLVTICDEACKRVGSVGAEFFDVLRLYSARASALYFLRLSDTRFSRHSTIQDIDVYDELSLAKKAVYENSLGPFGQPFKDGFFWKGESCNSLKVEVFDKRGNRTKIPCPPLVRHACEKYAMTADTKRGFIAYVKLPKPKTVVRSLMAAIEDFGSDQGVENAYEKLGAELESLHILRFTFSGVIDYDAACVFPKSRTPNVGVTPRNMTNYIALLPGRGEARAFFRRGPEEPFRESSDLNLLLIPFPFRIDAEAFVDRGAAIDRAGYSSKWFAMRQEWLRKGDSDHVSTNIIDAVDKLIATASREVANKVHGVVFPELSLNYKIYADLVKHLSKAHTDLEILIAGVSESPLAAAADQKKLRLRMLADRQRAGVGEPFESLLDVHGIGRVRNLEDLDNISGKGLKHGNYVATTLLARLGQRSDPTFLTTFQPKHHRWQIEKHQIDRYELQDYLARDKDWWETIETATRSLELTTFRGGTTLISLVCEDLARLEPCQRVLRSIGPNLVVALLMDGPQLIDRWSSRYATVLADDPGSSVLCLTSAALMSRSAAPDSLGRRIVALWRDPTGGTKEIALPHGCHGVMLKLRGQRQAEYTLDGRYDGGLAMTWKYVGALPIYDSDLSAPLPDGFTGRR